MTGVSQLKLYCVDSILHTKKKEMEEGLRSSLSQRI